VVTVVGAVVGAVVVELSRTVVVVTGVVVVGSVVVASLVLVAGIDVGEVVVVTFAASAA
jgi:hypothetical protein